MSRVLITGVAGFMGSHIADAFIAKGYEVRGIDNLIGGYEKNIPQGVEFFKVDLGDYNNLDGAFEGVDLVVHTACMAYEGLSVFSPALVVQNTLQITANALSMSVKHGVKKFIHMSSMARYGAQDTLPFTEDMTPKPQDPYGIAKYAADLLVKNVCTTHGIDHTIFVPHNIIGPRQKYDDPYRNVASIMINRILQGKQPIIYNDGSQMRCFSFMQDVVDPIMAVCETDIADGEIINIGPDDEFITIKNLAKRICKLMGVEFDPIYLPGRPQEVQFANCSADKARKLLGYKISASLDEGLDELVEWIKSEGVKPFSYHLPLEFVTETTPRTWSEKLM